MTHAVDVELMDKIKKYGSGGALEVDACFNCGNCTAVCPLAEDSSGFPRRVIRMAQVGMEKELLATEDIWRCYACGECTLTCPREANPAQFMAAARSYAISRYDLTGISRLMYNSVAGNIAVFLTLSAFFALLLLSHRGDIHGHPLALFEFIPGVWVHDIGVLLFTVIGLSAAGGAISMIYRVLRRKRPGGPPGFPISGLLPALLSSATDALNHRRFQSCDEEKSETLPLYLRPWVVHASIMWGFLAMLAATTLDFYLKPIGSHVPPWFPMRILGTLGGLACLFGTVVAITRRVRAKEEPYIHSAFSDWFFLVLLAATVFTGLLTEVVVYVPHPSIFGYALFLGHIVLAMDLLVMMPLTKFAHVLYRTLALALHHWANASSQQTADAASVL
jgi:ferredoxin